MEQWILQHEVTIRLVCFFGILALMMCLERYIPRRRRSLTRLQRWPANLSIVVLNSLIVRLFFPVAAVGIAAYAQQNNWGLLNQVVLPYPVGIITTIVILDFCIYWQHVIFHKVPILWRLHRVHHADQDYDVTTGSRFHPIEILFSMGVKTVIIIVLGAPPVAVLLFEIILNGMAMFNHSNIKLFKKADNILRALVVTPDFHRVHHSVINEEMNSNFGFNISVWDRLFGTYRPQPVLGHENMEIGLVKGLSPKLTNRLSGMLMLPFRKLKPSSTL